MKQVQGIGLSKLGFAFVLTALVMSSSLTLAQGPVGAVPAPLPPSAIEDRLFVVDQVEDAVFACSDLNGDGDANDAGEVVVFYDDSSPEPDLATPRFIAWGPDGALYVGDSNADFILRLEDGNNDGDANDAGEATIYYDTTSGGTLLVSINNIVFDADGFLYFSDNGTSGSTERHVTRIRDENGDGFCEAAAGEVTTIYELGTTNGVLIERPSGLAFAPDGTLLVSDYESDNIYRLIDLDGDLVANEAGEQEDYFLSGTVALNFSESVAFGPPEAGICPLYVNGGPVLDTVFRMYDADQDGTIDNDAEVGAFWDTTQADGVIPGVAFRIATSPNGALWVADGGQSSANVPDQVVFLQDLNADGDANDSGEARVFLDNTNLSGISLSTPSGLAFELPGMAPPMFTNFVRGDCNDDATTNIADAVFLLTVLFPGMGGPPSVSCDDACDANDDESLDIADAIALLGSIFGTPTVPLPAPATCGEDPNAAAGPLDCATFGGCP